jgi:hypothetical protein
MLVEAAWAAAKAPGPLHAFFVRIRAKRGHQIAAVALARKLTVLCWHLLTKDVDYLWARPALVANKVRSMAQSPHRLKNGQLAEHIVDVMPGSSHGGADDTADGRAVDAEEAGEVCGGAACVQHGEHFGSLLRR